MAIAPSLCRPTTCAFLLTLASCATHQVGPSDDVRLGARVYIEADYDSVWQHVTNAAAISRWYTAPCVQFGTQPGDALLWKQDDQVIYSGTLLALEKGRGLTFEFRFKCFDFKEPMSPVRLRVIEYGPTVLVEVEHDVTDTPKSAAIISPVGWTKPLSRLKTLLETGEPMAWPVDESSGR